VQPISLEMAPLRVECLRCGSERFLDRPARRQIDADACPRCEYVGWAPSEELDETLRRRVRMRTLERRRIHAA
jgi:Zn-finger nucleic acid-binding protein